VWRIAVGGSLYALAMLLMIGALILAFLDSHAPGLARSLGRYGKQRLLRRPEARAPIPRGRTIGSAGEHSAPAGATRTPTFPTRSR